MRIFVCKRYVNMATTENNTLLSAHELDRLFLRYKPSFVAVARSYVRDYMAAEDLVMDSFRAFLERQNRIDILPEMIPAYILATLRNRCLNWLRDRRKHLEIEQELHSSAARIAQMRIASLEVMDPEPLFAGEVSRIVRRELDSMPEPIRQIFTASRYHDKTYKQIAEENGITVNQVEFAISKATKIFRTALRDYLPVILLIASFSTFLS